MFVRRYFRLVFARRSLLQQRFFMKEIRFILVVLWMGSQCLWAQNTPATLAQTEFQDIPFPKPPQSPVKKDSLWMSVLELKLSLAKNAKKITLDFPSIEVGAMYVVSEELVNYFVRYHYETGKPYIEMLDVSSGKYTLSICTALPRHNLTKLIRMALDGKPMSVQIVPPTIHEPPVPMASEIKLSETAAPTPMPTKPTEAPKPAPKVSPRPAEPAKAPQPRADNRPPVAAPAKQPVAKDSAKKPLKTTTPKKRVINDF
jgi:hypothetical protein